MTCRFTELHNSNSYPGKIMYQLVHDKDTRGTLHDLVGDVQDGDVKVGGLDVDEASNLGLTAGLPITIGGYSLFATALLLFYY